MALDNLDHGFLILEPAMVDALRRGAKDAGCTPKQSALAMFRAMFHQSESETIPDFGPNADLLLSAGYDLRTIHLDVVPGEVEEVFLMLSPCGRNFFKSWNVIEKRSGSEWIPCDEPFGDFSEKRRHHFLEPLTREEAVALVRENLVPEEFRADFVPR